MEKPNVRDRLLESGLKVLHAQGFNATGVQEIADAAGVPKGSFYNYFDSKDAFAVEVIDRYLQSGKTLTILSDVTRGDALQRLRLYFEAMTQARRTKDYMAGCLMGNFSAELADQSRPVRDRLASAFAGWSRALETCLREAQSSGAVTQKVPAAVLANFLLNAWEGAVLRSKVDKDDSALTQFLAVTFECVLSP